MSVLQDVFEVGSYLDQEKGYRRMETCCVLVIQELSFLGDPEHD